MKFGIILNSNLAETAWNAFRFGNASLQGKHEVKVFLLGPGVECETIKSEKFNIKEQMDTFVAGGGKILSCGSCLKIRQMEGSEACPISTMRDMVRIVEESDKVLTFG
jgi:uncharacterized protein involved in oxidation of intracellular sulfur